MYDRLAFRIRNEQERNDYIRQYGWACISQDAIDSIVELNHPIIEICAGKAYWAYRLAQAGTDVIATDLRWQTERWHPVAPMDCAKAAGLFRDRALLMIWPPYGKDAASRALNAYRGDTLIYVGEYRGCTGDEDFHNALDAGWTLIREVAIPRWPGMNDSLTLYRRKQSSPSGTGTPHLTRTPKRHHVDQLPQTFPAG